MLPVLSLAAWWAVVKDSYLVAREHTEGFLILQISLCKMQLIARKWIS